MLNSHYDSISLNINTWRKLGVWDVKSNISPELILTYVPKWPLYVHLIAAVICMGCSAYYHLTSIVNERWKMIMSNLDYGGIAILIAGSSYPFIVYEFACK